MEVVGDGLQGIASLVMEAPNRLTGTCPDGEWKTHPAIRLDERRLALWGHAGKQALQKLGAHGRHVAGEKQEDVRRRPIQGGTNAAQGSAPGHLIAANHPHGNAQRTCRVPGPSKQGLSTDAQTGFVPPHPTAQSARQNDGLDDGRDGTCSTRCWGMS